MDLGIILGLTGVVAAAVAMLSIGRLNSRVERQRRLIDQNVAHISELRALLAEQREELDEYEETLAGIATPPAGEASGPAVVIYNPTKNADFDYLKTILARTAIDANLPEPIWLETTAEDPGFGQTRRALEMDASVVIVAGGDGTVRNVAEVLASTGTPLGLLPVGTGNLLARNLSLPFTSPRRMANIALTGRDSTIDVGWLEIAAANDADGSPLPDGASAAAPGKYAFVVMAGLGFDADIMAAADEESALKSKIGWLAYVKAAMPFLLSPKMNATVTTGRDSRPITLEARTIMMLNCGELIGGLVLDPHAKPDDGWLELAVLDTRRGLIGWGDLLGQVGLNGLGLKPVTIPGIENSGDIDVHRINCATILADTPQQVQVDGDVLGFASDVSGYIDEGALRVRVG